MKFIANYKMQKQTFEKIKKQMVYTHIRGYESKN